MKRNRANSSLSRCSAAGRTPKALPVQTIAKVILVFVALLCFGLTHLHLRFSLTALATETNYFQTQQGDLQSEIKALSSKAETYKTPEKLDEYAKNTLGMVRDRSQRETLEIPRAIYARYELARASQDSLLAGAGQDTPEAVWFEKLSERFGLISQALASELK